MSARPYEVPERQIDPACEAPRFFAVRGINLECSLCDASDRLARSNGCGEDWFCSRPCKVEGSHVPRDQAICLHHALVLS